jgi:lipoprotein-anchoring transpeptidase ErfK/SrfK
MYFTKDGAAIHGTYWHTSFGTPYSHGCINLPTDKAEKLYEWAPLGTKVVVTK